MRISCPSYINPGTYLENVRRIADIPDITSVELLFFFFSEDDERLIQKELPAIREYTDRLSFTVHMPGELQKEHRRIINLTGDIAEAFILHPPAAEDDGFLEIITDWIGEYGDIFLLENLIGRDVDDYLIQEPRLGVCLDTGHFILRNNGNMTDFLHRYGTRIREIHLHGISGGSDHHTFGPDEDWFRDLLPFLTHFSGVCNIEIFNEDGVLQVIEVLKAANAIGT